jgi:hypothetical protein
MRRINIELPNRSDKPSFVWAALYKWRCYVNFERSDVILHVGAVTRREETTSLRDKLNSSTSAQLPVGHNFHVLSESKPGASNSGFTSRCPQYHVFITADSENLVRAPFLKKSSASIRQTPQPPWSGIATEMRVDIGHTHLCTLQYSVDAVALGYCISM